MVTLSSIIQNVCDELSLPRPTSVVGNSDQTARTLLAHANKVGEDMMKVADWTVLTRLHSFTVVSGTAEYALPTDYDRLLRETEWDESNNRPLVGPTNEITWRTLKSSSLGSGIVGYRFRIFRGSSGVTRKIYLDPTPGNSADNLSFEYISNAWCADAAGTTLQTAWAADTDIPILDATLMELGIQLRYRRSRGLEFGSEADEYRTWLATLKSHDRPSPVISMTRGESLPLLDWRNVPETGYGP